MSTIPDTTAGDEILATWGQAVTDYLNGRTSIAAATGNIDNSPQVQVVGLTIDADSLIAGSTYRLTGYGVASNSAGSDQSLTLRVRIGPTTLTGNIACSRAPNIVNGAAGEGFGCEFIFTVRTAGASGTCIANGWSMSGPSNPLNTNAYVTQGTSTVAVDTTVANVLELTAVTGHASATANFTVATIERLTP